MCDATSTPPPVVIFRDHSSTSRFGPFRDNEGGVASGNDLRPGRALLAGRGRPGGSSTGLHGCPGRSGRHGARGRGRGPGERVVGQSCRAACLPRPRALLQPCTPKLHYGHWRMPRSVQVATATANRRGLVSEHTPIVPVAERRPAWYADKDIPLLVYRVNRRPRAQVSFFDSAPPSFLDHVAEVLLFGAQIVTSRGRHERTWTLGNREIDAEARYLAGWIGYRTEGAEEQDDYDPDALAWRTLVVETQRRATAPFTIIAASQLLFVAKHPTYSEGSLAVVFESLLQQGENARSGANTDWAVEPLLDTEDFTHWLGDTAVLDKVTFHVRLPNPDAAEEFEQITAHLRAQKAGRLDHTLTPADPERGLDKDFEQEPLSRGLMAMCRRAYAQVSARGRSAAATIRRYNQRERGRRDTVRMPSDHDAAQREIIEHGLNASSARE